ncbi:MAG: hypothetical protein WC227_01275 [Patescibacteria group bacterium]|jgi:hydrogenase-4 component E
MEHLIPTQFLFLVDLAVFLLIVLMHLAKQSRPFVYLYAVQSVLIASLMIYSAILDRSISLGFLAILILGIKVFAAPAFFLKLIKRQALQMSPNNYLNLPLTLTCIAIITTIAHSRFFQPLTTLAPANENALYICIASMFISLFLIINRKGALSQMIGILSLENAIVSFVLAAGLGQGLGLELGITFDIAVWIIVATVFVSIIYKKFHTTDVSAMTNLKG